MPCFNSNNSDYLSVLNDTLGFIPFEKYKNKYFGNILSKNWLIYVQTIDLKTSKQTFSNNIPFSVHLTFSIIL